jgi:hypothetical protein
MHLAFHGFDKGPGHPTRIPRPAGYLLIFCAAAAGVGGFSLLAVLVYVADEHPAIEAGAGCAIVMAVNLLVRLAGLREILGGLSAGPFLYLHHKFRRIATPCLYFSELF